MQELARNKNTIKRRKREPAERNGVPLTQEQIEGYLASLAAKGRVPDTIENYRRGIRRLYRDLPGVDKVIRPGTLHRWREELLQAGYSATAVNQFIVAANGYLGYVHAREFQLTDKLRIPEEVQPELTRNEYLRLLSMARALGKERAYLLVKVFGNTDLPVNELKNLTVEAAKAGQLCIEYNYSREVIRFPKAICRELLDYAQRSNIQSGPIFLTRNGSTMPRSGVTIAIRALCVAAGVPEEKGNPRCLRKLYQATRESIERSISRLVDQAQDRLLEEEQLTVGWGNA